jgi:hypothetical protein
MATSMAVAYEFARAGDLLYLGCGPTFSIAMEGARKQREPPALTSKARPPAR